MVLSWTIIIKDDTELPFLKKAIDSVYEYVDEIILTANGKEVKQIEEYAKTLPKVKYFYLK